MRRTATMHDPASRSSGRGVQIAETLKRSRFLRGAKQVEARAGPGTARETMRTKFSPANCGYSNDTQPSAVQRPGPADRSTRESSRGTRMYTDDRVRDGCVPAARVPAPQARDPEALLSPAVRSIFFFPERLLRPPLARGIDDPAQIQDLHRTGDFTAIGLEFLRHFIGIGGLEPNERVLDVGCGIGRMAIPLTRYLGAEGFLRRIRHRRRGHRVVPDADHSAFSSVPFHGRRRLQRPVSSRRQVPSAGLRLSISSRVVRFRFSHIGVHAHAACDIDNYVRQIARVLRPAVAA